MLKILLISPPIFDFYYTPVRKEPLGLMYIKQSLAGIKNVEVTLYDTTLSRGVKQQAMPECFQYLEKIYQPDKSTFSLFSNYYRFGDSFAKIVKRVSTVKYDVIGISALFSGYFPDIERLIRIIKKHTHAIIVVGGWAVTTGGTELFRHSQADFFLCGSGEYIFPRFIQAVKEEIEFAQVPGIIYRRGDLIYTNPLPRFTTISEAYPAREYKYYYKKKRIAKMIISQGCLHHCTFCTVHRFLHFSQRSISSIKNELNSLVTHGVQVVNFEDDNLFAGGTFADEFLDVLSEYHTKGLDYTAMNGITASNIDSRIEQVIQAGFIELNLSLVTKDTLLRMKLRRPVDFARLKTLINSINGRIPTTVFLILGLPESNPQDLVNEILSLANLSVSIGVSPLYLIPGIPLLEKLGIPSDYRLLRSSALYKFGSNFSRADIATLWKLVRMINHIKKKNNQFSHQDLENLHHFHKSLYEKQWYRLTPNQTWEKSFTFSVTIPEDFSVITDNGLSFHLSDYT